MLNNESCQPKNTNMSPLLWENAQAMTLYDWTRSSCHQGLCTCSCVVQVSKQTDLTYLCSYPIF